MARRPRRTKGRRSSDEVDFDKHIGQRLRERRVLLGLNQTALADGLGITFQQVRNYETGCNRISAGKLYGCAELLDVPPEYFFEGLESSGSGTPDQTRSVEAMKLARAYYSISDPEQRQRVRRMVHAIAASNS